MKYRIHYEKLGEEYSILVSRYTSECCAVGDETRESAVAVKVFNMPRDQTQVQMQRLL
jgi:hypothetical protein